MPKHEAPKTEFVAVLLGQHGVKKIVYLSAASLVADAIEQTLNGWVISHIYERQRQTYNDTDFPELARS
jgi:hypothetical protein